MGRGRKRRARICPRFFFLPWKLCYICHLDENLISRILKCRSSRLFFIFIPYQFPLHRPCTGLPIWNARIVISADRQFDSTNNLNQIFLSQIEYLWWNIFSSTKCWCCSYFTAKANVCTHLIYGQHCMFMSDRTGKKIPV